MSTCKHVYEHICENLDQELDSPQCREIKKHLEACPDCMAYLDSLKKTVSLYRAVPAPKVPRSVHARLIKVITLSSGKQKSGFHTTGKGSRARRA